MFCLILAETGRMICVRSDKFLNKGAKELGVVMNVQAYVLYEISESWWLWDRLRLITGNSMIFRPQ